LAVYGKTTRGDRELGRADSLRFRVVWVRVEISNTALGFYSAVVGGLGTGGRQGTTGSPVAAGS